MSSVDNLEEQSQEWLHPEGLSPRPEGDIPEPGRADIEEQKNMIKRECGYS